MSALIGWLPVVPLALSLWICVAYLVAFLRTRQPHWLVGVITIPIFGLLLGLSIIARLLQWPALLIWLSLIGWIGYPVMLLMLLSWMERRELYGSVGQLLLLRAPRLGPEGLPRRRWTRPDVLLFIASTLLLGLVSAGLTTQRIRAELASGPPCADCLGMLPEDASIAGMAFSPDGALLTIDGVEGAIRSWRVSDLQLQSTLGALGHPTRYVAFSPDGALVADASDGLNLRLVRVADGSLVRTLPIEPLKVQILSIRFSPDGQFVGVSVSTNTQQRFVRLWRVADGSLIRRLPAGGWDLAVSPDGALLARQDSDSSIVLLRLSDSVVVRRIREPFGSSEAMAFSPDGRLLANLSLAEGKVVLWRTSDWQMLRTIKQDPMSTYSMAFSPDSRLLAIGTQDGQVQLWRLADGQLLRAWKQKELWVRAVAFSPDGRTLAATIWGYAYLWRVPQ